MNLFISTATDKIYLMLFTADKKIIKEIIYQGKNNHTEKLYEKLAELNIKYREIENVYVVNGPGSYTGLRVAVVFAKTLAMLTGAKLYPISLMEALYYSNNQQAIYVDAKGKKYYQYLGDEISLIKVDEYENGLIDPEINMDALLKSGYLSNIEAVNYLELEVNYVKTAI